MRPCSVAVGWIACTEYSPGGEIEALGHVAGGEHALGAGLQVRDRPARRGRSRARAPLQEADGWARRRRRARPDGRRSSRRCPAPPPCRRPRRFAASIPRDPGRGEHADVLGSAPALQHAACRGVHHARDHAVFHLDHGEIAAALGERLQDDAADEARADQHDVGVLVEQLRDPAAVLQGPAVVHAGEVEAGHRRAERGRACSDQQAIVGDRLAAAEGERAVRRCHGFRPPLAVLDAEALVVAFGLAEVGPALLDHALEDVRDRHPRIGRLRLVADEDDVGGPVSLAQGFGSDHAGRAGTHDHMLHVGSRLAVRAVPCARARARQGTARLVSFSAVVSDTSRGTGALFGARGPPSSRE